MRGITINQIASRVSIAYVSYRGDAIRRKGIGKKTIRSPLA